MLIVHKKFDVYTELEPKRYKYDQDENLKDLKEYNASIPYHDINTIK